MKRKRVLKEFDRMIKKMSDVYRKYCDDEIDHVQPDRRAMSMIIGYVQETRGRFMTPIEIDEEADKYCEPEE